MADQSATGKKTRGGVWFKLEKIRKANVRRKRLDKLEVLVVERENDVARRSADLLGFGADKMIESNGAFRRARFLREKADERLSETRLEIESTKKELAEYMDGIELQDINLPAKKAEEIEVKEDYKPDWAGKAEAWGKQHRVDDLVRYVDLPSGRFEVIDLYKAREAKTTVSNNVWPSFFASVVEGDLADKEEREQGVEKLLALSQGDPRLERLVGILSTKGMLHMVMVESLTLRDNVLPVCTDPEKLAEGRKALENCEVIDAEAYRDNFE
jgi:hypothetical protein